MQLQSITLHVNFTHNFLTQNPSWIPKLIFLTWLLRPWPRRSLVQPQGNCSKALLHQVDEVWNIAKVNILHIPQCKERVKNHNMHQVISSVYDWVLVLLRKHVGRHHGHHQQHRQCSRGCQPRHSTQHQGQGLMIPCWTFSPGTVLFCKNPKQIWTKLELLWTYLDIIHSYTF